MRTKFTRNLILKEQQCTDFMWYSSTTVNVTLMWNQNLPVFVGFTQLLDQILTGWNKHGIVNSWCRQRIKCWASWLSLNVTACSGFEESAWAWNKCLAALSQTDLLQFWFFCKTVLRSPSTVWHFGAVIQHPMAWLNQMFLLTLPVSAVFISFRRTNGSLCHCLGFHVKYFIVLTSRRKKTNALCPTWILPNQREAMCS